MRAGTAFWLLVGAILALSVGLRALDPEPIVRLRLLAFDTLFGGSDHHFRRHATLGGRTQA